MTLPSFELPKPGKHGQVLYELAAASFKRKGLLGYFGACLRQKEQPTEEDARPFMELAGIPHGDRKRFVRDLVAEAKRQRSVAERRIQDRWRVARRMDNTMLHRRLKAYRVLFPEAETKRYFAKLLKIKLTKGVHFTVEGFDCRLRPVHIALVLVYHHEERNLRTFGFLLFRPKKGWLGSVPVHRDGKDPINAKPKIPDIPGLIRALEIDSVAEARAQGCDVEVDWNSRHHIVRAPDGRVARIAWRPKLLF
jgi:hypothetical protein